MNLTDILNGYKRYDSLAADLNNTPVSVAGVVDSAQPQLIAALSAKNGGNALVVTYSDMEARAMADNLRLYAPDTVMFPTREYIFYNIETMGRANGKNTEQKRECRCRVR